MSLLTADVVHWLHLTAAVLWVGGTFFYLVILLPSLKDLDPGQARRLSVVVGMRFRALTLVALLIAFLTGLALVSQFLQLGPDHSDFFTSYQGRVLGVKIVLALLAIADGVFIAFALAPRLVLALEAKDEDRVLALGRRIGFLTGIALLLGLGILVCVALLHAYA